jgi:hypothetical protein
MDRCQVIKELTISEFVDMMLDQDMQGKHSLKMQNITSFAEERARQWGKIATYQAEQPESKGKKPFLVVSQFPIASLQFEHAPENCDLVTYYAEQETSFPPVYISLSEHMVSNGVKNARIVNGNHRVAAAQSRGDRTITIVMSQHTWFWIQQLGLCGNHKHYRRNADEEEVAKYRELLAGTTDFIEREAYHRRLLEAQGITPSNSMAVLDSTVEACDETLKAHGYNFIRRLGSGSHGYVYSSGPGEVTKITRSPMEAAIAQLFVGEKMTCFPEIDSVEDITLLCDSHMPLFAIRREHIHDFKGSKELYLRIREAMHLIWNNVGIENIVKRLDEADTLTENELSRLEEYVHCAYAVKRKYRFIYNDIGVSNLGTRADGSIVIRDFSHCCFIRE